MWARRLLIGSGLAVASMIAIPATAGAASTTTNCGSMTETGGCVTPTTPSQPGQHGGVSQQPTPPATHTVSPTVAAPTEPSTTSLPFTGADVEELAVIGVGAVLAGGILIRRRRNPAL
jgi:LPXTG-motif cell wall-anchored protein